jgi:hypothetical protein
MTNNRDLLKEAIADAKSVKETAIANAKLALEEAFTPYLKDQLSAKLQEMDDEDEEKAPKKEEKEVEVKKENVEEINLDELLAELELNEDEKTDAEQEGYEDGMEDEKEDIDDEEVDLEDLSEDDLKSFIEDVIKDMVAAGEIEPGDEFADEDVDVEVEDEDVDVEVEDSIDIEDVEDVDVDIEIDEAKDELDELSNPDQRKKYKKESKPEKRTEDDAKGGDDEDKLGEALAALDELKTELNEVNLLNAKLLYTNKIFKAKNLTESKKVKVLKAFDKATDVKQAKAIYETLNEGIVNTITNSRVNESVKRGAASKASGLEPKAKKQPILESNEVYDRMRKLAGLI